MKTRLQRWAEKVQLSEGCWLWTGSINNSGYGTFCGDNGSVGAHVFGYERFVGPVPDGYELDHTCDTRSCANPAHVEPRTHRDNVVKSERTPSGQNARKTHCVRGHEFTEASTRTGDRRRECKACATIRGRKLRHRRKANNLFQGVSA